MIAVDDVGAFAALAFAEPEEYAGKALDLAGAEMTMPQVAQIFSEVLGRDVVFEEMDLAALAAESPGLVPMYKWLGERGFEVDIPALRAQHPWLKTFGEWAQGSHREPAGDPTTPCTAPWATTSPRSSNEAT